MSKKSKGGFTLIELVVTMAVIAVLVAIAIPVVSHTVDGAVLSAASTDSQTLEYHLRLAKADVDTNNDDTYGSDLITSATFSVGDVISFHSFEDICKPRVYNGREFVPVWNFASRGVELMYTDDSTNVETGVLITNYIIISENCTTLVVNLSR